MEVVIDRFTDGTEIAGMNCSDPESAVNLEQSAVLAGTMRFYGVEVVGVPD